MSIFIYTFKKIILSIANWIIFVLTIVGLIFFYYLSYYLNRKVINSQIGAIDKNKPNNINYDLIYQTFLWPGWQLGVFVILISIFLFIFIAINSAKILRDEMDDGTLLILVSKPLSRWKIWSQKFLAFEVVTILYIACSLIISSFIILLPHFGGGIIAYRVFWWFLASSIGLIIVIQLFMSAIGIVVSLFFKGVIVASIIVGFGFFFSISNQVIDRIITEAIGQEYTKLARATKTMQLIYQNVPETTFQRLINLNLGSIVSNISSLFTTLYSQYIFQQSEYKYPDYYSSQDEQKIFYEIVVEKKTDKYSEIMKHKDLITDIYYVSQVLQYDKNMSYLQMIYPKMHYYNLTGYAVFVDSYNSPVKYYSLMEMFQSFQHKILGIIYDEINVNLNRLKFLRKINIFYHVSFIWEGFFLEKYQNNLLNPQLNSTFFSAWSSNPYFIKLQKIRPHDSILNEYYYGIDYKTYDYQIKNEPSLNWTWIIGFYVTFSFAILGISIYIFNRKDFV